MNEDMLADWANVSASINAQVDDANAELNTSISDMLSDVDSSLGEVRVQISTFEDESEAFAEEARAVKADYIDEYNPYRKLVVEAPVYVCFVVLVLGAIGLGLGVMGKRLSFLYTIMCIFCFILIFFFCLGHTVYFPITWVLANVCELKDVAIEAARESGTSDTAAVWAAFDECQQVRSNTKGEGNGGVDGREGKGEEGKGGKRGRGGAWFVHMLWYALGMLCCFASVRVGKSSMWFVCC